MPVPGGAVAVARPGTEAGAAARSVRARLGGLGLGGEERGVVGGRGAERRRATHRGGRGPARRRPHHDHLVPHVRPQAADVAEQHEESPVGLERVLTGPLHLARDEDLLAAVLGHRHRHLRPLQDAVGQQDRQLALELERRVRGGLHLPEDRES